MEPHLHSLVCPTCENTTLEIDGDILTAYRLWIGGINDYGEVLEQWVDTNVISP